MFMLQSPPGSLRVIISLPLGRSIPSPLANRPMELFDEQVWRFHSATQNADTVLQKDVVVFVNIFQFTIWKILTIYHLLLFCCCWIISWQICVGLCSHSFRFTHKTAKLQMHRLFLVLYCFKLSSPSQQNPVRSTQHSKSVSRLCRHGNAGHPWRELGQKPAPSLAIYWSKWKLYGHKCWCT